MIGGRADQALQEQQEVTLHAAHATHSAQIKEVGPAWWRVHQPAPLCRLLGAPWVCPAATWVGAVHPPKKSRPPPHKPLRREQAPLQLSVLH